DLPPSLAPLPCGEKSRNRELEMIEKFCDIDPMEFFAFPANEPPPPPPPLELDIYPTFAEFIDIGGASKHVITNKGTQRIVWKVRCSNNSLFKVCPVFAFLDPNQSMDLHVRSLVEYSIYCTLLHIAYLFS
ncbi:hypothetical protein PFISCL1PPCAC_10763, partial [Pristionchus fissidentatus]